jgi:hypothetical protein
VNHSWEKSIQDKMQLDVDGIDILIGQLPIAS